MGERFGVDDPAADPEGRGIVHEETGGSIDGECIQAVLDHRRRRQVLDVVTDLDVATTRDVATQVAAREVGVRPSDVTDEQRREVTVSLYHIHVPKLADVGVLEVEQGMERIRPGPKAEPLVDALDGLFDELDAESERVQPDP